MSERIWMVGGTTGEYSDRSEWCVDAWRSEEEAQARVLFLKNRMQELGINGRQGYDAPGLLEMRKEDPAFSCDYTGTDYYVCELELKP